MNIIKNAKRIVVKVGSSTLTHDSGLFNFRRIEQLSVILSDFANSGKQVVLVSSGAVAAGRGKMNYDHRPSTTVEKQAMAAIGQCELMSIYEKFFSLYGRNVAQILLTKETIENEVSRQNAQNTFSKLLELGVIPIVNENDTVSYSEIEFGDNDTLSAYVAVLVEADALINLSDIDGFYDSDPHVNPDAKLIPTIAAIDDNIRSMAGGSSSNRGTGGVITKLHAAEICTSASIPMFLINGANPELLYDLFEGRHVGTYFMSR